MRRRRRVHLLVLALLAALPASAETFDLYVWPYCFPGTDCGFGSEQEMQIRVYETVQEMNLLWKVTGISFRPTIMPINTSIPLYSGALGCSTDVEFKCSISGEGCTDDANCPATESCLCIGDGCVCDNDFSQSCSHDSECANTCNDHDRFVRYQWRDQVAALYPEAISLMLRKGAAGCCSNVASATKPSGELFGVWCDAGRDPIYGGDLWAHEMGHHWCLSHTFDARDTADGTPDWDADDDGGPNDVTDTPADACVIEDDDRVPECNFAGTPCDDDNDCSSLDYCDRVIFAPQHEFCTTLKLLGVDDGSPRPRYCTGSCSQCPAGEPCGGNYNGVLTPLNLGTEWHHVMAYYSGCKGPYVVNGMPTEAISQSSTDRIQWCRNNVALRVLLPDVCDGSGDSDHDGFCDDEDTCKFVPNTWQIDSDNDTLGDACDPCPFNPLPTGDLDEDGIGDLCDDDRDGDGCLNWLDRDPDEAQLRSHAISYLGCGGTGRTVYEFGGDDFDGDGIPNCWDVDNDNDGACDSAGSFPPDSCFTVPHPSPSCNGTIAGCTGPDPCPFGICDYVDDVSPCPPLWPVCVGTDCSEYLLRIFDVVNPGPEDVIVDTFQIWNETLFMRPSVGQTPSQLAVAVAGGVTGLVAAGGVQLRMDIEHRDSGAWVATVIDAFAPGDFSFGTFTHGPWVRLDPAAMTVETTYGAGMMPGDEVGDQDGDQRPDWADNCIDVANFLRADADGDGFGDLCDADLDNDGWVTDADVVAVTDCLGADLTLEYPLLEPDDVEFDLEGGGGVESPDLAAVEFAYGCRAADLDGDSMVTMADVSIASARVGGRPGPSGTGNLAPVAEAGMDASQACGGSIPLDASASTDPEAAPLTCQWSSPACVVAAADACVTTASCPSGAHTVSLVVDDGTHASAPDTLSVSVVCAGRVPPTLTVDKVGGSTALQLSWSPSCDPGAEDYGIFEGMIGDWYSHEIVTCNDTDADLTEEVDPKDGNRYYLVAPWGGAADGSFGATGSGIERPPAVDGFCAAGHAPAACP